MRRFRRTGGGWMLLALAGVALGCGTGSAPAQERGAAGQSCYGNGTCNAGLYCVADTCVADTTCVPDCAGLECGVDPVCGVGCGTCTDGQSCLDGWCDDTQCEPDCTGRECGPDSRCQQSCGSCEPGASCVAGSCRDDACTPDCTGRECGPDPECGTDCGPCDQGSTCDADGRCNATPCVKECAQRECGLDLVCNQSCGTCEDGFSCTAGACVQNVCLPECGSRECGLEPVCGTSCGTCTASDSCKAGQCAWLAATYTVDCSGGMCRVPAGKFWMGCNTTVDTECGRKPNEAPYHQVSLSAFWMDRTEVTVQQYAACVDQGNCSAPNQYPSGCNWGVTGRDQHPVNCVSWDQAVTYCSWAGKRLPTEAEWEKAARGTDGRLAPWGNETADCTFAMMYQNSIGDGCGTDATAVACSRSPAGDSPYGFCDLLGNVAEWVADVYGGDYYSWSPDSDPPGPDPDFNPVRVVRGGNYTDAAYDIRVSRRGWRAPASVSPEPTLGFRCAMGW